MKACSLAAVAAAALLALQHAAQAQTVVSFSAFRVTATIPVSMVTEGTTSDVITKKTLKTADIVNLALGQSLGTKLDSDLILAISATFEDHGGPPLSSLIVYDRSQIGLAQEKVVVAKLNTLEFENAYQNRVNKGFGFGTATIQATTMGDPSKWGFLQTDFSGSGLGGGPHARLVNGAFVVSPVGTGSINGRFKFNTTDRNGVTTLFDGICTKGSLRLSGKALGSYEKTL